MSVRSTRPVLVGAAVALLLAAGVLSSGSALDAQAEAGAEILVGTYQPQQVAQAVGFQQRVMQNMVGLQERAQQAQAAGDQQAMQQIQAEAQQIEQQAASDLLAEIEAVMPQVAEKTGALIIATGVSYAAPGVTTEDVTETVIAALGSEAAPNAEVDEPGA
jgi:hypothetical protein